MENTPIPRQGFWGRIKDILRRTPETPPPPPPHNGGGHPHTNSEPPPPRAMSEAERVHQMMKNISPSHVAREIIPDALSTESLKNEAFRKFILNIALLERDTDISGDVSKLRDIDMRHNEDWLKKRKAELESIDEVALATAADREVRKLMIRNIDRMLARSDAYSDERKTAIKTIQLVQTGNEPEPVVVLQQFLNEPGNLPNSGHFGETFEQIRGQLSAETFDGILKTPPDKGGGVDGLKAHIENIAKQIQDERGKIVQDFNREIQKEGDRVARARIEDEMLGQLRKADRLLGKVAQMHLKEFGKGLIGRLHDQARTLGGWENLRNELQKDEEFRDYMFYNIIAPIIENPKLDQSRALFSFHLQGELEEFMDIIRRTPEVGEKLVSHYSMLREVIFQSNDMDYYAAHPGQDIKEFRQSTVFFTNTHIDFASQNPLVALSKRMYEVAIMQIRENHGGYIPRKYLEYDTGSGSIILDEMVRKMVFAAIQNKQFYNTPRDPVTGHYMQDLYGRLQQGRDPRELYDLNKLYGGHSEHSTEWRRKLGDFTIAAALKQAKGLALVDMRLLEQIARSKGSGSIMMTKQEAQKYTFGDPGKLGSIPYEGIVQYLEPIIHLYSRFAIGGRHFLPFFNMLVTDKPFWEPNKMSRLIQLHMDGDHENIRKEFGNEIDTRLITMDNPFGFSGMWGTFTGWRNAMASAKWDDWDRERFSTANKLTFVGDSFVRLADAHGHLHDTAHGDIRNIEGKAKQKVDDHFLFDDTVHRGSDNRTAHEFHELLKDRYKQALLRSGDPEMINKAQSRDDFDLLWLETGRREVDPTVGKTYDDQLKDHLNDVQKTHKHLADNSEYRRQLTMKLERAYKARIWAQAAMRNPLAVARELKSSYEIAGHHRDDAPLRKRLIWEILNIDLSRFEEAREPTKEELATLQRVTDLEGAVASMTQKALRENRDLQASDFADIQEVPLRENALKYWNGVRKEMLGINPHTGELRTGKDWYGKLGIDDAPTERARGLRFHRINWQAVEEIDLHGKGEHHGIFHHHDHDFESHLMTGKTVDRDWRYLFSTEDMGWEYLNITALGPRNPVRRVGDLDGHVQSLGALNKILSPAGGAMSGGKLNEKAFHESMTELWNAITIDDMTVGYDVAGRIMYTTGQMFRKADWAWRIPGIGQAIGMVKKTSLMELLYGKVHGQTMGPNDLLKLVHDGEQAGYILPSAINPLTGKRDHWTEWDAHTIEKRLGGTVPNAVYEMATQALMAIIAITVFRALTAKSEDEDEGGGGGGGHH